MRRLAVAAALLVATGCASVRPMPGDSTPPPPMPLAQWLQAHPLPPDQNFLIVELDRTKTSSMHIVQIRDREVLHLHARHDVMAMLQEGRGVLTLGEDTRRLGPGSVVKIPRGMPHAFVNESSSPAVVFAVFTPPLDQPDSVPVTSSP